jgi:hypothetical protein
MICDQVFCFDTFDGDSDNDTDIDNGIKHNSRLLIYTHNHN